MIDKKVTGRPTTAPQFKKIMTKTKTTSHKTNNRPELSPYRIYCAEFFPSYGVVTKHDRKQFGEIFCEYKSPKTYRKNFKSKADAVEYLTKFNKRLDKTYTVRLCTDKQRSLAKQSEYYRIHYTRKQWNETYKIG